MRKTDQELGKSDQLSECYETLGFSTPTREKEIIDNKYQLLIYEKEKSNQELQKIHIAYKTVINKLLDDCYHTLDLPEGASKEDARKAYLRLQKKTHPDRSKKEDATQRTQEIENAYKTINSLSAKELSHYAWHVLYQYRQQHPFQLQEPNGFGEDLLAVFLNELREKLGESANPFGLSSSKETPPPVLALIALKCVVNCEQLSLDELIHILQQDDYKFNKQYQVQVVTTRPNYLDREPNTYFLIYNKSEKKWQGLYFNERLQEENIELNTIKGLPEYLEEFICHSDQKNIPLEEIDVTGLSACLFPHHIRHTQNKLSPIWRAPEIFGDVFLWETPTESPSNPDEQARPLPYKKKFQSLLALGNGSLVRFYADRYRAQEKESTLGGDSNDPIPSPNKNFLSRIQWSVVTDIVDEYNSAAARIAWENPKYLVSFDPKARDGKGDWSFSPKVRELLFARLKSIDDFFQEYLKILDESITTLAHAQTEIENSVDQLNTFLEKTAEAIKNILQRHFVEIKDQLFYDLLKEKTIAKQLNDELILKELNDALKSHFDNCAKSKEYSAVHTFIEDFKDQFLNVISYQVAKIDLLAEIEKEKIDTLERNARDVLAQAEAIVHNEKNPCYKKLTEALTTTTNALRCKSKENAEAVLACANRMPGKPSKLWRGLGGLLMLIGVGVMALGVAAVAFTAVPTLGFGAAAGAKIAAIGYAAFAVGALSFFKGSRKGLSESLHQLGKDKNLRVKKSESESDSASLLPAGVTPS